MIRTIRIACIALFLLSLASYVGVSVYERSHADHTAPEITMSEDEITISVEDEESMILSGITASDNKDGDVTGYLTLEKLSSFTSPGTRTASIAVFDNAGNVSRISRTVHYSDYVSPRVILKEPLKAPVNDVTSLLDKIQIIDCLDGDITENLQIVPQKSVSSFDAGDYNMSLQVSNNVGDTLDLPVTVEFYDTTSRNNMEVIELTDYLIYVTKDSRVDPLSYLKSLTIYSDTYIWNARKKKFMADQTSADSVMHPPENDPLTNDPLEDTNSSIDISKMDIYNPVDTSVPGVYEIQYTLKNYETFADASVRLIVVVEEE